MGGEIYHSLITGERSGRETTGETEKGRNFVFVFWCSPFPSMN
jgi:hypothetical protein